MKLLIGKSLIAMVGITVFSAVTRISILVMCRMFIETRFVATSSMVPTLQINDRIVVEKVSDLLNRPHKRGEIIVYYPPPIELDASDLKPDFLSLLSRRSGVTLSTWARLLSHKLGNKHEENSPKQIFDDIAFVQRVIGLPGDKVRIVPGKGVYVNGTRMTEYYLLSNAKYRLQKLRDIGGRNIYGDIIQPFGNAATGEIVVPRAKLFVLGDNRSNDHDSHVFGFVDFDRVIGRAYGQMRLISVPKWIW